MGIYVERGEAYNQLTAARHPYFEWNNPGFEGIHGYEEYLKRQTDDVGAADASFAARRATQPIGTPDEIIDKIKTLQQAISLAKGPLVELQQDSERENELDQGMLVGAV